MGWVGCLQRELGRLSKALGVLLLKKKVLAVVVVVLGGLCRCCGCFQRSVLLWLSNEVCVVAVDAK